MPNFVMGFAPMHETGGSCGCQTVEWIGRLFQWGFARPQVGCSRNDRPFTPAAIPGAFAVDSAKISIAEGVLNEG
jgi:hypothetical protein